MINRDTAKVEKSIYACRNYISMDFGLLCVKFCSGGSRNFWWGMNGREATVCTGVSPSRMGVRGITPEKIFNF